MRNRLSRLRPTPGVVIAAIAVFFAIGGIGYAAATIGTNDIKNGAVTNKKIKKHTIKKSRLAFTVHNGATGPRGATGPAGAAGTPGAGVNYNARLSAGGSISRTVGAFTVATSANGAANCAATTITSTQAAHYTQVIDNSDPFAGTALTAGTPSTVQAAAFGLENLKAVANDGSSQLMGQPIGCSNFGGFAVTYGSLLGD
jgi:hypothetical protein